MKKLIISAFLCLICTGCIYNNPIVGNEYKVVGVKYTREYNKKYKVKLFCLNKSRSGDGSVILYSDTLYVVGDTVKIK